MNDPIETEKRKHRATIARLVRSIAPHDALERAHRDDVLAWIDAEEELCRLSAPATPPKHLVSYFVHVDSAARAVLLVDHRKAGLWLPSGGHVEPLEHPLETVRRECREELGLDAEPVMPEPLFVTVTETVGITAGHTDVSLWFVLRGDAGVVPRFDEGECSAIAWFPLDGLPIERADPHLGRFAAKLAKWLDR